MIKDYNDYVEEFKTNILEWVHSYNMTFQEAFDGMKDYFYLVPLDYRDDLYKELKEWSMKND